jgi:hypothetical protein
MNIWIWMPIFNFSGIHKYLFTINCWYLQHNIMSWRNLVKSTTAMTTNILKNIPKCMQWYHKQVQTCILRFVCTNDELLHVSVDCALILVEWYHHTYRCDDTRGRVMQFWPPADEHMCSKHVEAWNKLIVKQKFCASSWLITEINILRCTVSKTSKFKP